LRSLGIDYGGKRVGVAVSDGLGLMAHGLPTLRNTSDEAVIAELTKIIAEREIGEIVIGLPRNMNDTLGPQAQRVEAFAEKLKPLGLPVRFIDERLTTERARRVMLEAGFTHAQQRKNVDRMAAQFILQIHLDSRRATKEG
jgi:putative Holliday junction resolvase